MSDEQQVCPKCGSEVRDRQWHGNHRVLVFECGSAKSAAKFIQSDRCTIAAQAREIAALKNQVAAYQEWERLLPSHRRMKRDA